MRRPCSRRRSRASIRCSRTRLSVAGVVDFSMARQSDETYVKDIEAMRREKDFFFKEEHDSPIPYGLRDKFSGLAYFSVDPKDRIRSRLVRDPNPQSVVLATSKGIPRDMIRVGVFEFEIDGTKQRLAAYKAVPQLGHHHEDRSLFVPFRDAPSGKETYGAARYIDIEEHPADEDILDANVVGWGHLSRPELFGRQRVHRVRIDEFRHRRGMARLILDPYSLPGTVPEATETEVVRWIWTKRAEVSEETQRFSRPNVLGQGNRYGRIWNRTVDRMSRVPEVQDVPPAAITLTVTLGPEAAIPAYC